MGVIMVVTGENGLDISVRKNVINQNLQYRFKMPLVDENINQTPQETINPLCILTRVPKVLDRAPKQVTRQSKLRRNKSDYEYTLVRTPKLISLDELSEDIQQIEGVIAGMARKELRFALTHNSVMCDLEDYVADAKNHIVKRYNQGAFNPKEKDIIYKKVDGEFVLHEDGTRRIDSRHWAIRLAGNKLKHIRSWWSTSKRRGALGNTTYMSQMLDVIHDQTFNEYSAKKEEDQSTHKEEVDAGETEQNKCKCRISGHAFEKINKRHRYEIPEHVRERFSGELGFKIWKTYIEQPIDYIKFIETKMEEQQTKAKLKNKKVFSKCLDGDNLKWVAEYFELGSKNKVKNILKNFLKESGLQTEWDIAECFAVS